jgi:hypothetical protein
MSRKKQKRAESTAAEFTALAEKARQQDELEAAGDEELFIVDRGGSKSARARVEREVAQTSTGIFSATERKLVRKIQSRSQPAESALVKRDSKGLDLWSEEAPVAAKKSNASNASKPRRQLIVRAGQSYNPSQEAHQEILAEVGHLKLSSVS